MAAPELPTIEQIVGIKDVLKTLQAAWNDSFTSPVHCREFGGFIYAVPARPTAKVMFIHAKPGISDSQQAPIRPSMAIDLSEPPSKHPSVKGYILVATFHTHPLHISTMGGQEPSKKDLENGWYRQVPAMVISRTGIWAYSEANRTDRRKPTGYPPEPTDPVPGHFPYHRVNDNKGKPLWVPEKAPYQWDPTPCHEMLPGIARSVEMYNDMATPRGEDEDFGGILMVPYGESAEVVREESE